MILSGIWHCCSRSIPISKFYFYINELYACNVLHPVATHKFRCVDMSVNSL
jgi:hypothetical protein